MALHLMGGSEEVARTVLSGSELHPHRCVSETALHPYLAVVRDAARQETFLPLLPSGLEGGNGELPVTCRSFGEPVTAGDGHCRQAFLYRNRIRLLFMNLKLDHRCV